jgi:two-component system response regulator (stage 0 sporulation protein F)
LFIAKRILLISQDVKFTLNAKQALEREGVYNVSVYSSGKSAVDFLRQNAQDLALVDFRVKDMPGTDIIDHMRAMQHDLAIIAAPDHPAIHDLKDKYNIQAIINIPIPTRKLVAFFNEALKTMYEAQPDTQKSPASTMTGTNPSSVLEFWLAENPDGDTVLERPLRVESEIPPEASANFERLAAEEPPMPSFEEGSTIRDLRARLTNLDDIKRVLANAAAEETDKRSPINDPSEPETDRIPAALILETALDDSTPIRTFSLQEFLSRVHERGSKNISPLPSWQAESEKYVREPDFLPDSMPEVDEVLEYTATVTMPSEAQTIEQDPGGMVTDPLEPIQRSRPAEDKAQEIPVIEAPEEITDEDTGVVSVFEGLEESVEDAGEALDEIEAEAHIADFQAIQAPPIILNAESDTAEGVPFAEYDKTDPQIVQLAATLTQVALELTADATVISRAGAIIAYAGKLPPSDIEDLREQLTMEWGKAEQEGKADKSRILFATVPASGEEYMISTRSSDEGFTISLIFSGTRPLHEIRRQSKRIVEALAAVPESPAEIAETLLEAQAPAQPIPKIAIPSTDEIGIRTPIALLWLLHDPDFEIPNAVQQKVIKSLDVELTTTGWKVKEIQAPDYLYIYGEMPASLKPRDVLKELMEKTAFILRQAYPKLEGNLWDDSYLIKQNGRAMTSEEIQRFLNFARR